MNIAFLIIFIASSVVLLVTKPEAYLSALLSGAESSLALCFTLAVIYTVWLGLLNVAKDAGLTRALARGMKPVTSRLFRTKNEGALDKISVNLSANFLGMGGAATPAGVSAMKLLDGKDEKYSRAMLFVVNCSGLQILPATVIALREKFGSVSSYDIILPVLLSCLVSLLVGMLLVRVIYGRKK